MFELNVAQVVSKKRVANHGEVFTAEREVDAMLDLVDQELARIDSRFLEPACGTGNFLVPIYEKKLEIVKKRYAKSQLEFERNVVVATGSIYGIDILEDNVRLCRKRLFEMLDDVYTSIYKKKSRETVRSVIRFILNRNILWGDALSLKTVETQPEPIIFSEWTLTRGSMIKRRDFSFAELIPSKHGEPNLFQETVVSDLGTPAFIPSPVKEYPLTHFGSLV